MRKTAAFLFAVLLICFCGLHVLAAEAKYATAGEYWDSWEGERPDFITSAYYTDGGFANVVFGLVDNEVGRAAQQEILNLIEDDSTVSFIYQTYSYNELDEIFQEMHKYFEMEMGLVMLGVDSSENCVAMEILEEKANDPETLKLIEEIKGLYADKVSVRWISKDQAPVPCDPEEPTVEPTVSTEPTQPAEPEASPPMLSDSNRSMLPVLIVTVSAVLVLTVIVTACRKRSATDQQ